MKLTLQLDSLFFCVEQLTGKEACLLFMVLSLESLNSQTFLFLSQILYEN